MEDEIPFEVPDGWAWCRLGEIATKLVDGDHNPPKGIKTKSDFLMLSSRNINQNKIVDLENVRYLEKEIFDIENKRTDLHKGDILFTSVGSLGRSCVFNGKGNYCFQRSVTVLNTKVENSYIKYFFDSQYYQRVISENATGTAQLGFYMEQMSKSLVALPPLAEQKAIVAKIEEIFLQIDILENNKTDLQTTIKHAKSKILDLAIHGKLVPQDPNDEPASKLLDRIHSNCEFDEGKQSKRSEKILHNGRYEKLEDVPFAVPDGWVWCKLGEICRPFGRIGFRGYTKNDLVSKGAGAISLSPSNMKDMSINFNQCTYISWEKYYESPEIMLEENDIVIVKTGSSYGKTCIVKNMPEKTTLNPQLMVLKNIEINYFYLCYFLNSFYFKKKYEELVNGTAIPTFSQEKFSNNFIPLPPLNEQKRIVEKIESLFSIFDQITKNIS